MLHVGNSPWTGCHLHPWGQNSHSIPPPTTTTTTNNQELTPSHGKGAAGRERKGKGGTKLLGGDGRPQNSLQKRCQARNPVPSTRGPRGRRHRYSLVQQPSGPRVAKYIHSLPHDIHRHSTPRATMQHRFPVGAVSMWDALSG